jgi:hypothetical protein
MAADEEETLLAPAPTVVVVVPPLHQQHRSAEIASTSGKHCDDADANMSKATFVQVGNYFTLQPVKWSDPLI